jgi:hypothetical protein
MKTFRIIAAISFLLFAMLLSIRLDVYNRIFVEKETAVFLPADALPETDSWMNIFQNNRKIGYSHTLFSKKDNRYLFKEELFMRINTMGLAQDLRLKTKATLNPDLTLAVFDFEINSGRIFFSASGEVAGETLSIKTKYDGSVQNITVKLKEKPFITAGILPAVINAGLGPGDKMRFNVFDPATMGQATATVKVLEKEDVLNMGIMTSATKVELNFKGAIQNAWIAENGDLLKESGLLGITLVKTSRYNAIKGLAIEPSQDLTKVASVKSNVQFPDTKKLDKLHVKISGINFDHLSIHGGRQHLEGNILTIHKESLNDFKKPEESWANNLGKEDKAFLKPTAFIQSQHPEFVKLMTKILSEDDRPGEKVKKIMAWIHSNIKKRPVLSVPDALTTLKTRVGDCNEHAMLFAAMSRAAGIPSKVEAGLVYLDGRFYYHAWNAVYVGSWITVDSLFNQMPADVTHIRFTSGSQKEQLDLLGLVGNVNIEVQL